jgi:hypothetical protein
MEPNRGSAICRARRGWDGQSRSRQATFADQPELARQAGLLRPRPGARRLRRRPAPPVTAPTGINDSRQKLYETNRFEQAEGGRLFRWTGCDACHTESATGAAHLPDDRWAHGGATAQIYRTVAAGAPEMPAYGASLTPR